MLPGLHRHLFRETIILDLDSRLDFPEEDEELTAKRRWGLKVQVLETLVGALAATGKIVNPSKCLKDMVHRESKATTAFGEGFAMPHVRTLQARDFLVGVLRSRRGVNFDSLDGAPVRLFVGVLCPPYEDRLYLRFLAALARAVQREKLVERALAVRDEVELLGLFCRMETG